MKKPQIPENEKERLATLRAMRILDSSPEERYDRITSMAQRLFDVRIALVSLVDENRQWFKSKQGLDASETPRDISFCGHAILKDETFIVSDTFKDERFADNPLVTQQPKIRFYAGVPLSAPNHLVMGTLCLIDDQPRELTPIELDFLKDLAKLAEMELAKEGSTLVDEISGKADTRFFLTMVKYLLKYSKGMKFPSTMVMIDLPKTDQHEEIEGYSFRHTLLLEISRTLAKSVRHSDVVGRFARDSFYILLPKCSIQDSALPMQRVDRHMEALRKKFNLPKQFLFDVKTLEWSAKDESYITEVISKAESFIRESGL